jgi:cell division protein FtsB
MKPGHRFLFSIYISFMVYSIVIMIWGPAGTIQTSKLQVYKEKLIQNTDELSRISTKLNLQSNRLRTDQSLIELKARELGFFLKGEGEIIVKGFHKNNINFSIGSYYNSFNQIIPNVNYIRVISTFIGILVFFILTIFRTKLKFQKRKYTVSG